jgi:hypothetical protein
MSLTQRITTFHLAAQDLLLSPRHTLLNQLNVGGAHSPAVGPELSHVESVVRTHGVLNVLMDVLRRIAARKVEPPAVKADVVAEPVQPVLERRAKLGVLFRKGTWIYLSCAWLNKTAKLANLVCLARGWCLRDLARLASRCRQSV